MGLKYDLGEVERDAMWNVLRGKTFFVHIGAYQTLFFLGGTETRLRYAPLDVYVYMGGVVREVNASVLCGFWSLSRAQTEWQLSQFLFSDYKVLCADLDKQLSLV